jgi:DNA polymerase II large subunit
MVEVNFGIKRYFEDINNKLNLAYKIAGRARKKRYDPEDKVEIPIAKNMAERVEGLISAISPEIKNTGIPNRITELEKKFGILDWRVALTIALEIAQEKFCKFNDKLKAIETGIKLGFAYITLGTVASPLEGLTNIKIRKRKDNKEYFAIFYSGPVRSAGGTGAAVSVLITDYIRKKMGYDMYDATEQEIKRMVTEVYDYHERVTNLQYLPSIEEIEFLIKFLPVQIDGEPSEKLEVSNYKDLERIETNNIRNGPCLVIGECVAQKAKKIWTQLSKWGNDFELDHWSFLKDFIELQKRVKSKNKEEEKETNKTSKISPDLGFINDLVAGRPVLTHPLKEGGFRLRYGRTRTSGFSSSAVHPATMAVLGGYIAIGTQLKTERPGKSTVLTTCDSLEAPVVLLENGSVIKLETEKQARQLLKDIKKILFLGDVLINYGDFYNRAHLLVPPGYCPEWWVQELEKATVKFFGNLDIDKLSEMIEVEKSILENILKEPIRTKISARLALQLSEKMNIPLHPDYTFFWKSITKDQFLILINSFKKANFVQENNQLQKIILKYEASVKQILETLCIPHIIVSNEFIVIDKDNAEIIDYIFKNIKDIKEIERKNEDVLDILNEISPIKVRDKGGVFIGARMGRPEKAKMRHLTGSPQVLFPVGEDGGRLRSFQSAIENKKIRADFPMFYCSKCKKDTVFRICETCEKPTKQLFYCKVCGEIEHNVCKQHGKTTNFRTKDIDIVSIFTSCLEKLKINSYPELIKGVRGTSNKEHIPEHIIKGILRAKHNIYVNKDGTTRYDMTQLGITHFKPKEIETSIEKLKEMGYEKDINGKELKDPEQILEIKPQDVILPKCNSAIDEGADKVLFRVANFIDDLLEHFYNLKPFYNLRNYEDLVGHLVLGLAPHTSAAIIGRILGFSKTQGFFAHPMFHAAMRRDLDGDESSVILLMDALLNFSRKFLPVHRGATQDACLVLTSKLVPNEIDDMVFDMDVCFNYPLEFYDACMEYKDPRDIQLDQIGKRLGTKLEYSGMGFTHNTNDFNTGVKCSAYKLIPSMEDKLKGQMSLAEKIKAVDETDVARLVIEKHFLKDIKGNLRKFSMQQFRCVKCNEKYRRPPLIGKCIECGGRIIFTISEGSVIKYLEPSISLADKYNVPPYLKQSLELVKRRIEGVFGKEKEKQEGLGRWFG